MSKAQPTTSILSLLTDPMWYGITLLAIIVAEQIRRLLPGDTLDFAHYAATLPLVVFLSLTAYERFRRREAWPRAIAFGLAMAVLILVIGWLKGRL